MRKGFLKIISATVLALMLVTPAYAINTDCDYVKIAKNTESNTSIMPLADEIVYTFRVNAITGKRQYRRWNQTKGYWVDPDWIDVPGQ